MRPVPWGPRDLLVLYMCTLGGLGLVGVGWFGASSSVVVGDQVRWVIVAAVGVVLLGAGNLAWLLTGRRGVGQLRGHLAMAAVATRQEGELASTTLVSGIGMTRFHRHDCQLVADKSIETATQSKFLRAGLRPCGVCRPGDEGPS